MSDSWNCEEKLRELAEKLHAHAYELESAADVLKTLRDSANYENEISSAKRWAKDWMNRE